MKYILKGEEFLMLVASIILLNQLEYSPWWYLGMLFLPDVGMIGYLINSFLGSTTYNLTHHKGIAIVAFIAGTYSGIDALQLGGLISFGHSSLDRVFGFGLKYPDSFAHTHLGVIANRLSNTMPDQ